MEIKNFHTWDPYGEKQPKVTTKFLKEFIVSNLKDNIDEIIRTEFCDLEEGDDKEIRDAALDERSWKRFSKRKETHPLIIRYEIGEIHREFDCRPLDDQLRALIITDPSDSKILSITVGGE